MKEIWEAHTAFEEARPMTRHSPYWYGTRLEKEAGELVDSTHNDPNPEQLKEMVNEGADVLIFLIAYFNSVGVSPSDLLQATLEKIDYNERRFPTELFGSDSTLTYDEAYRIAKEREGRPLSKPVVVYDSSFIDGVEL